MPFRMRHESCRSRAWLIFDVGQNRMRSYSALAILFLAGCANRPAELVIPVTALESGATSVVGRLGKSLGTVMVIEAVVVEVSEKLATFGSVGHQYGLRVESVGGRVLDDPITFRFIVERSGPLVKLASSELGLNQLIDQLTRDGQFPVLTDDGELTESKAVSKAEAESVRNGYVGSRHTLLAFETGVFFGAPVGVPENLGFVFSGPNKFHFSSHLTVFSEAEKQPNKAPEPTPTSVTPPANER
jgi:hypothetical protein